MWLSLTVIQADILWGCPSVYPLTNTVFVTKHVTFPTRPITFQVTATVVTNTILYPSTHILASTNACVVSANARCKSITEQNGGPPHCTSYVMCVSLRVACVRHIEVLCAAVCDCWRFRDSSRPACVHCLGQTVGPFPVAPF